MYENIKAVHWKLPKLFFRNQSFDKVPLWPWPSTFWPQNVKVSSSHHPVSMYEIWKLYVENYSSYCVRTKVLTKFRCDLDFNLLTQKCIGIFLSPSCIYVWNMKAVIETYSSNRVRTKVLTKFRYDLDLWTPKCKGIFLSQSCTYVWNLY